MTTNKPEALELARRTIRQLSNAERDRILEQYLSDGIAVDKARIAELEAALIGVREQPAPAVQGEPVAWSLRFRHGDKYEHVGPINYMTTFGSKKDADIYANKVARDLDGNPEPERRPVVVPLYVAPPAEQQPAPDVTGLVDALEDINQWVSRWASADHPVAKAARKALAAYRKQGGEC